MYEPLGKVIFVEGASGDSHTYLLITSDENPTSGQAEYSTPGAGDWLGLDKNTEVIVLRGRILGNLNDDIECDWVKSLFVDGSIPLTSNVFHYGSEMDGSMSNRSQWRSRWKCNPI